MPCWLLAMPQPESGILKQSQSLQNPINQFNLAGVENAIVDQRAVPVQDHQAAGFGLCAFSGTACFSSA